MLIIFLSAQRIAISEHQPASLLYPLQVRCVMFGISCMRITMIIFLWTWALLGAGIAFGDDDTTPCCPILGASVLSPHQYHILTSLYRGLVARPGGLLRVYRSPVHSLHPSYGSELFRWAHVHSQDVFSEDSRGCYRFQHAETGDDKPFCAG